MDLNLDLSLGYVPRTISDLLREVSATTEISHKLSRLDTYVTGLEDELRKIEAFKRELPLSMILLNDAIVRLKEEAMQWRELNDPPPLTEEIRPLKGKPVEDGGVILEKKDQKNWMSSVQLWSTDINFDQRKLALRSEDDDQLGAGKVTQLCNNGSKGGAFVDFQGIGKAIAPQVPARSLMPPLSSPLVPVKIQSKQQDPQETRRKQRRCWSPELHRRFVDALQQLGGSQATPKQIRDLMQVDGLTNDEVKSHLQKYRLHVRKLPSSVSGPENGSSMEQSLCKDHSETNGSPQGPLNAGGSGSGGDSMEGEEDERSDGRSWRGVLLKLE
ncbi:transcription factor HHO5-like isoform X2 [Tripterygium wilfordii]|uniref:transcription factor HHO5-like isoform X2 n=1 Tax=Tripterygium wilfordii TaxID=458696 RepID=UPI0018F83711|nr:transcription factor HHO5-like isoform X2 [Tripterygium wilfordii]